MDSDFFSPLSGATKPQISSSHHCRYSAPLCLHLVHARGASKVLALNQLYGRNNLVHSDSMSLPHVFPAVPCLINHSLLTPETGYTS